MTQVTYKCKICGANRFAQYDDTCPIKKIESWIALLTCDSCYDFRDRYLQHAKAVADQAYKILSARLCKIKDLGEVETKTRANINHLTKRLCGIVTAHYGETNVWDSSLAETIFERPKQAWYLMNTYLRGVRQLKQSAQSAA